MRYRFVQDVKVPGALEVVTVRSQRASARIEGIDLPELPPGAVAVVAADIPGSAVLEDEGVRMPILAGSAVAYVGEPVALVAAPDLAVAQGLARSVAVRYADRDPESPAAEGEGDIVETVLRGEPEDSIPGEVREMVTSPRRFAPPAPQEAVVVWDGQALEVRTATLDPFHVRAAVAGALGLPASRVRVLAEPVDGCGGKLRMPSLVAVHAALVAFRTGSAARVRYSWREELSVAFRIAGTRASWRAVAAAEGRPPAARLALSIEGGACDLGASLVARRASAALAGPYPSLAVSATVRYRADQTVPCELPPGCGDLEAVCARELCATELAAAEGLDPAEWRIRSLTPWGNPEAAPETGASRPRAPRKGSGPVEVLRAVAEASGFHRRHAACEVTKERRARSPSDVPMRGVGIALATFPAGLGPGAEQGTRVRLAVAKDRRVTVYTSAVDAGRGNQRLFARIVSEELGVPAGHVSVAAVDTSVVPSSGPTVASRTAAVMVPLLRRVCSSAKARLRKGSASFSVESTFRGGGDGPAISAASAAGTVAAVEVDPATRMLRCTGVWVVIDAGEILDPDEARAVACSSLVRGIGIAFAEESEAAVVPVPPATDPWAAPAPVYRIARLGDFGTLSVGFLDHSHDHGRVPPLAVSELALLGVVPALAAAVAQATGIPVTRLPIRPSALSWEQGAQP
jgi:CO/xanthine dehydrogenase Mo-binding subunit